MKILKIEQVDNIETYDLEVQNNHNYIANNLIVHNSTQDGLIKSINPDCFDDVVAINAINRPGPLENFAPVFGKWKRWEKEGNKKELENIKLLRYPFPFMEKSLEKTYGCLLYQEQFMLMVCEAAGFNMGEADSFRRAISWKEDHPKYHTVKKYFDRLEKGMSEKGYTKEDVDTFLEYCRGFMGYSYNLCLTENHTVTSKGRGEIKLLDVELDEEILTYNSKTGMNEYNNVENIHCNEEKEIYRITLENGQTIESTLDHKFYTEKGMIPLKEILELGLTVKINKETSLCLTKTSKDKPKWVVDGFLQGLNYENQVKFEEVLNKIYENIKNLHLYDNAIYTVAKHRFIQNNFKLDVESYLVFAKTEGKGLVAFN